MTRLKDELMLSEFEYDPDLHAVEVCEEPISQADFNSMFAEELSKVEDGNELRDLIRLYMIRYSLDHDGFKDLLNHNCVALLEEKSTQFNILRTGKKSQTTTLL